MRFRGEGIQLTIAGVSVSGNFQFEQITLAGQKVIRVGADHVALNFDDPTYDLVSLDQGQGGFILTFEGIAGILKGHFTGNLPAVTLDTELALGINTTATAVDETLVLPSSEIRINVPGNFFALTFVQVSLNFGDILTLTGNFTVQRLDLNNDGITDKTLFAAQNVELFLGSGPPRLSDGTLNPEAIGVLVTGAKVGVVQFADKTFAIEAFGKASFVGLNGLTITGTLHVRVNKTGQAINETITLPGTNSGQVAVAFNSPQFVEVFEAGVNEQGQPDPNSLISISAGGVFKVSGAVRSRARRPTRSMWISPPRQSPSTFRTAISFRRYSV